MRYVSVCSGIEAASVAWHPLRWEPVAFCEIEPFPSAVLAHHWPNVPNYGDFTRLIDAAHPIHATRPDLLVGGTPCQAFSVAGLRRGLADARGGLTLDFLRLAQALQPRWVVWENVPGVLSQDGGGAFGSFLGALGELGYGWAYRVLDAQYVRVDGYPHAVPQRRRRVFVVGCAGGGFARAAAVLLEPEGVRRDPPTRRATRQGAAPDAAGGFEVCGTLSDGAHHGGGLNGQDAYTGRILPVAFDTTQITHPENRSSPKAGDPCHPLAAGAHPPALAFDARQSDVNIYGDKSGPLDTDWHSVGVVASMSVRRLTPTECERLQGFPDGHTLIPWKGKPAADCPDGPRYKALGNSMAVNVMRWIGMRIAEVER